MSVTVDRRRQLARWGEEAAAAFLRSLGYAVLTANYRCPAGEIDLVCRDGRTLVFVEVKTRSTRSAGWPEEAVDATKASRLRRAALHFLGTHRLGPVPFRFDVVAVEVGLVQGQAPRIRHHVNAIA